ncbi:hypothetical protein D3C76_1440330 [compost metagenome]
MNDLYELLSLLWRCRHAIKQSLTVALHHRERRPNFMRDICNKITAHFLKSHFLGYIPQNGYSTTYLSIRSERSHMYRPYSLFDVNIHALVFFLIKHTSIHR